MADRSPFLWKRWTAPISSSSGSSVITPYTFRIEADVVDSIYQSIEILSKEKGIDAQIVLDAVKDAMLIVALKDFRTTENYESVFDENSGGLRLFAVKTVAEVVADP